MPIFWLLLQLNIGSKYWLSSLLLINTIGISPEKSYQSVSDINRRLTLRCTLYFSTPLFQKCRKCKFLERLFFLLQSEGIAWFHLLPSTTFWKVSTSLLAVLRIVCVVGDVRVILRSLMFHCSLSLEIHIMPVSCFPWCHPWTNTTVFYPTRPRPLLLSWLEFEQKVSVR